MWVRRVWSSWLALLLSFQITAVSQAAETASEPLPGEIPLNSEAVLLLEANTGTVLYEKNPHVRFYPASITKIVTALVALEESRLEDQVTVSKNARYEEGTRVFLAEGEQRSLEDLIYGMLVNSGNDAATAIAEHIAGSKRDFAVRMNRLIVEKVGVRDTHFVNASGLHDPQQYTTASDMAQIARYAMQNPVFRQIVSTKTRSWDGEEWKSELVNHNKLLWRYEGANGIKNGYTSQSGNTLVASASREGMELIAVGLKAESSEKIYADLSRLMDYGFSHYETRLILPAKQEVGAGRLKVSMKETGTVEGNAIKHPVNEKRLWSDERGERGSERPLDRSHSERRLFYSETPVYATLSKGEHVTFQVDAAGNLLLWREDKGYDKLAVLQVKEETTASTLTVQSQTDNQALWWRVAVKWLIWLIWLAMLLMMLLFLHVRRQVKRSRQRSGQWH